MPSHDLDVVALMAGVGFTGLAVVALITEGAGVATRWTCPLLLILVGVVGLIASQRDQKS